MATFLGITRGKVMTWKSGNMPAHEDLKVLHERFGLSCHWLITQQGDLYDPTIPRKCEVPLKRLAACGIEKWDKTLEPSSTLFPVYSSEMIAVVASGDSLIPAGVLSGMVCFCDTQKEAALGDIVYIERVDGLAALKVYLGQGVPEKHIAREGRLAFQEWVMTESGGWVAQYLDLHREQVKTLAPVTLIQRNQ